MLGGAALLTYTGYIFSIFTTKTHIFMRRYSVLFLETFTLDFHFLVFLCKFKDIENSVYFYWVFIDEVVDNLNIIVLFLMSDISFSFKFLKVIQISLQVWQHKTEPVWRSKLTSYPLRLVPLTMIITDNLSAIRGKANLKTGITRKQITPNFPRSKYFLPPDTHTHVCVSGGKKCLFFGKFGLLSFCVTPVWRFAHLPYYRRIGIFSMHAMICLTII